MADGWISVHRKIEECWVWFDEPFSKGQAWIDLLLLVNHAPKKCVVDGVLTEIGEGERLTSIRKLAERWQWSRKKTTKFLEILEKDEMIEIKKSHHFTVIKVRNYGLYQGELREKRATKEPPRSHERATEEPPRNTNNNDNNEKNEKKENNNTSTEADEIDEAFDKIYDIYPKKVGKTKAKARHRQWLKGRKVNGKTVRLTNAQIWRAVAKYVQSKGDSELQYYKDFNVLLGDCLLDYVEEEE